MCVFLQLWMMKGQIEEQGKNNESARDAYNQGVSYPAFLTCLLLT